MLEVVGEIRDYFFRSIDENLLYMSSSTRNLRAKESNLSSARLAIQEDEL